MADCKIILEGKSPQEIAHALRAQAALFWTSPFSTPRWWWGFACGAAFMALLNIGDLHVCVGECDAAGVRLAQPAKGGL